MRVRGPRTSPWPGALASKAPFQHLMTQSPVPGASSSGQMAAVGGAGAGAGLQAQVAAYRAGRTRRVPPGRRHRAGWRSLPEIGAKKSGRGRCDPRTQGKRRQGDRPGARGRGPRCWGCLYSTGSSQGTGPAPQRRTCSAAPCRRACITSKVAGLIAPALDAIAKARLFLVRASFRADSDMTGFWIAHTGYFVIDGVAVAQFHLYHERRASPPKWPRITKIANGKSVVNAGYGAQSPLGPLSARPLPPSAARITKMANGKSVVNARYGAQSPLGLGGG